MSLTRDDLQAIKTIVDGAIDESDQRTAAGFAEVHEKFAEVHEKIDRKTDELSAKLDALDDRLSVKDGLAFYLGIG